MLQIELKATELVMLKSKSYNISIIDRLPSTAVPRDALSVSLCPTKNCDKAIQG